MSDSPRILLFGLYELGFRSLQAMVARNFPVAGVVTKPESSLELPSLVQLARTLHLPVLAPDTPRQARFLRAVRALAPDLIAVAGYHRILPPALLRLPARGTINLHGSLLPAYRGPCPWKWAIVNGETRTGATVQRMTSNLDRGDILTQCEVPIGAEDTGESLFMKICAVAGPLLARTIEELDVGGIVPRAQEERLASYQGYPTDDDARIRWQWSAERIRNLVRAFCPRPGAWTPYGGRRVQILKAVPVEGPHARAPGMILGRQDESLLVSTGRGNLALSGLAIDGDPLPPWTGGPEPGTFFDPPPLGITERAVPSAEPRPR
jgi:methionyl-tRNA formyltransferase